MYIVWQRKNIEIVVFYLYLASIDELINIFKYVFTLGTLTKEGLDFLGAQPVANGSFAPMQSPETPGHTLSADIMRALASCHAVARFGTTYVGNQVCTRAYIYAHFIHGNVSDINVLDRSKTKVNKSLCQQVEVKMFTATGWDLIERGGRPPVVKSSGDEVCIYVSVIIVYICLLFSHTE